MSQIQYIHARCPECGSQMNYAQAGPVRQLKCTQCSYVRGLGMNSDQLQGRSLDAGVSVKHLVRGLRLQANSYTCQSCEAVTVWDGEAPPGSCPFCEGADFAQDQSHEKVAEPYYLIPFAISARSAQARLRGHLGQLWLLPDALKALLEPERLHAVYVPFFHFDALTRSTWRAMVGFSFVEDTKGGKVDRKVWEPSTGYYEHFFENFAIPATTGLDLVALDDILPFDWGKVVPYDPRYLHHTQVERYQEDEIGTFRLANQLLDMEIKDAVISRLPGHEVNKLVITTEKHSIAFRHLLVPVWVGSFVFRGQRYQYLINGQTGKITGDQPIDNRRLARLVGGIVLGCILLVLLLS